MLAAIYCRLSVEDENHSSAREYSESILNQQLLLTDYANKHGMDIYAVYVDENYSGLNNKRPAFCRLLDDARHGRFEVILCKSQSRFTRDLETADTYLNHLFPVWGIRFISIVDGVDTRETKSRKMRQLNGLINEWYCEDLSDNIRAVLRKKMESGQFIGSFACYGYTKDPADHHHLIPDPPAAAIVRQIYQWYLEGASIGRIAALLTERHVPRPSSYKRQNGLLFQAPFTQDSNGRWSVSTIKRILSNPVYTGSLVQGKEQKLCCKSDRRITVPKDQWIIVKDTHQPIIGEEAFLQVQELLAARRKKNFSKAVTHSPKST